MRLDTWKWKTIEECNEGRGKKLPQYLTNLRIYCKTYTANSRNTRIERVPLNQIMGQSCNNCGACRFFVSIFKLGIPTKDKASLSKDFVTNFDMIMDDVNQRLNGRNSNETSQSEQPKVVVRSAPTRFYSIR